MVLGVLALIAFYWVVCMIGVEAVRGFCRYASMKRVQRGWKYISAVNRCALTLFMGSLVLIVAAFFFHQLLGAWFVLRIFLIACFFQAISSRIVGAAAAEIKRRRAESDAMGQKAGGR